MAVAFAACNGGEKNSRVQRRLQKRRHAQKNTARNALMTVRKECCSDKKGGEEAHACGDDCKDGCTHNAEEAHACADECADGCAHKTEDAHVCGHE